MPGSRESEGATSDSSQSEGDIPRDLPSSRNRGERPAGAPTDEEIERLIEERFLALQDMPAVHLSRRHQQSRGIGVAWSFR